MPCGTVTNKNNQIIRKFLGQVFEEYAHAVRIAIRHHQKEGLSRKGLHSSVSISVFTNMVAWYAGTKAILTPTIFGLVDAPQTSLILKHETYFSVTCDIYFSGDKRFNFFEESISSSLAFLGCRLRGITFRHP